jgi:hypothetical protein
LVWWELLVRYCYLQATGITASNSLVLELWLLRPFQAHRVFSSDLTNVFDSEEEKPKQTEKEKKVTVFLLK